MQKVIVFMSICLLMLLLAQVQHGVEATKSAKSEKGSDYNGEETENHGKGQHHKMPFRSNKKLVLDGEESDVYRKIIPPAHEGAGGSYTLQIQVEVPLQTAYSPKRGGSGGYPEESSSGSGSGDGEVPDPFASSLSWLTSPIQLKDFA